MARAIWSGAISFGLVNIPVRVFPAIREHDVRFHQLDAKTGNRIRYKRVDEKTGREVDYANIVKGYEVSSGRHVEVTDEELAILRPEATKTVDIEDFVELNDIDPIYFERSYFLVPDDNAGAKKAYALLRAAMEARGKIGIGRVVLRSKQYLAAVRPVKSALMLSTMLFADEVVDQKDVDGIPSRATRPADREVEMAAQLVDSLTAEWKPSRYKDTYQDELKALIDAKREGKEIVAPDHAEPEAKVVDLMAALEASLEGSKKRKQAGSRRGATRRKKRSAA